MTLNGRPLVPTADPATYHVRLREAATLIVTELARCGHLIRPTLRAAYEQAGDLTELERIRDAITPANVHATIVAEVYREAAAVILARHAAAILLEAAR